MSADAASLPCPICLHTGVFNSVQSLRDRLISVSTNKTLCPVCQEEVSGLDKLTIHLFKHVKIFNAQDNSEKEILKVTDFQTKPENENQNPPSSRQKKVKSVSKNKSAASSINTPVKFVKIYPKLPVVSLNTVPVIDLSHGAVQECLQNGNSMYVQTVKTESSLLQTNTTCNICSLQFVDTNILKMHKCLIHNIDESTNHNFTRYHCHLCPKNFKMRGSLMVHLRVAHYGFSSGNYQSDSTNKRSGGDKKLDQCTDNKLTNYDRNENKQWQCDVCLKCFTTKYFLKKHKRLHTGETPYACTQCNKTFTFQQSYHKHLLYHNDEKPHTCNYCGRAFKELSTLHNHQRIHTGEKPFSCETCGKCFRQRVSYLVHRRIHTGVMPYKCTACNKSFRYKVSQRTHKCQAQPPGTVVRQSGDLIEKLKKKQVDSNVTSKKNKESLLHDMNIQDMSERNINLLRKGAMLSIENTEVENFSLIAEAFNETDTVQYITHPEMIDKSEIKESKTQVLNSEIEDLIDSIPTVDKNVPSPSEILKKLCLSKEDDSMTSVKEDNITNYDMYKEFNTFL